MEVQAKNFDKKWAVRGIILASLILVQMTLSWDDSQAYSWFEYALLTLLIELILLVGVIMIKPWAWCMTILFSTYALYAAFESTMGNRFPGKIEEVQFAAAPLCVLLLMLGHHHFAIKRRDVIFLCVGFILTLTVIYVRGRYFPFGSIDYVRPVPYLLFIYDSSNLRGPLTLLLMWGCYLGIASLASSFAIIRRALRFP